MSLAGSGIDRIFPIRLAREHPRDIGVDDRFRSIEGKTGDCARRVAPDARQLRELRGIVREFTAKRLQRRLRRPLEIARARVVA